MNLSAYVLSFFYKIRVIFYSIKSENCSIYLFYLPYIQVAQFTLIAFLVVFYPCYSKQMGINFQNSTLFLIQTPVFLLGNSVIFKRRLLNFNQRKVIVLLLLLIMPLKLLNLIKWHLYFQKCVLIK